MFDSSFRVVASLFRRFLVSLRCFVPSSRPPIRPVVLLPRWLRSLVSICHSSRRFASLMFRFVVSLRLFVRASLWTRKGIIRPWITWGSWLTGKYGELAKGWRNWEPTSARGYSVFSTAYTNSSMRVRAKWAISHYTFWQSDIYSFTSFFLILRSHRVGTFVAESSSNNCCR